jgi:DNA polymerase III subunit beta
MIMEINVKELKRAVENCSLIVPKKTTIPVLGLIKVESEKNRLKLTATDLEEFYTVSVPVKKGETFSVLAPADQLLKVLKNVKNETLELSAKEDKEAGTATICIESGMTFTLTAETGVDDFPLAPFDTFKRSAAVKVFNQKVLFEIMKKVSFSTTKNNVNRAYSGILFAQKKEHLDIVTTDIHRLSIVRTGIASTKADFVVPVDSVKNILKIFGNVSITKVNLEKEPPEEKQPGKPAQPVKIMVMSDNESYVSRLLRNEFPEYDRVVKSDIVDKCGFGVDKKVFAEKLKSVMDFHNGKKVIRGAFDFVDGTLHIDSGCGDGTSIETSVEIKPFNEKKEAVKIIGLNVKYLHEAVSNMDDIAMNMEEGGTLKPFYLADIQPDYRFYHLVMPIKMKNLRSRKASSEKNRMSKAA